MALGAVAWAAIAPEASATPKVFPLSKVKRGQKGYGLTTIQGTVPERFGFEVIGITRNFLPKMDIILVKSDDPKLKVSGFWQGMSGSPLFIDEQLVCAFSYGFRFNKVAIGGCTPIQYMREEGFRSARRVREVATPRPGTGNSPTPLSGARRSGKKRIIRQSAATFDEWLRVVPDGDIGAALQRSGESRSPWLLGGPLPAVSEAVSGRDPEHGLVASAVPLAMSGFSAPAFNEAKKILGQYPLAPMQAGGTGSSNQGPTSFTLGSAIAVQLIRGDMSAAATGTVSFVDGNGVLAFGHPMFQAGEIYAPVAAAEIHTVIPSAFSAFIVSSPLRELGALIQDRQSTIAADTGLKVRMIPVRISVTSSDGKKSETETFNVEILDNRFFTGTFAAVAAMNAASLYLPDQDHVTVRVKSKIELQGHKPIRFTDYLYSPTGAGGAIRGSRGLRVLVPLLMNPFAPVEIDNIEIDIGVAYGTNYGEITAVRLPTAELEPGQRSYVDVELTRYDGQKLVDRVPFEVPSKLAGSIVKLEVSSGDAAALDAAPPKTLHDLLAALRKLLPGTVYAVTLHSAEQGAAIRGRLVRDLPASALDKLITSSTTTDMKIHKVMARSTYPAKRVLAGKQSVLVKIRDLDN